MSRKPIVADQFYELREDELKEQIKSCFFSKFGPGKLPEKRNKNIIGAVSPHAGYDFSGPGAAHVYKEIGETPVPDTYIIFGPSHSGYETCISMEDWETPFGKVKIDKELGKIISKKIHVDEEAHLTEHSIEVQLPFLQFVNEKKDFKILPIMISHDKNPEEIGSIIKEAIAESEKNVIIIASSDMTHYGYSYGYVPFTINVKEKMHELDNKAVEHIKNLNAKKFLDYVKEKQATICGALPIAALLNTISPKKAKLLKYFTSGDIMGDYGTAVGYAAIVFE